MQMTISTQGQPHPKTEELHLDGYWLFLTFQKGQDLWIIPHSAPRGRQRIVFVFFFFFKKAVISPLRSCNLTYKDPVLLLWQFLNYYFSLFFLAFLKSFITLYSNITFSVFAFLNENQVFCYIYVLLWSIAMKAQTKVKNYYMKSRKTNWPSQ